MNTIRISAIAIILIGIFNISCEDDKKKDSAESLSPISDTELPAEAAFGEDVNFIVSHSVYSGCGYYSSQKTTQDGNTLTVTFYARYHDGVCTADVPTRKTNYRFTPSQKGVYTFKFNKGNGDYLTQTITIN